MSVTPRLAYQDPSFMDSDEGRPIRIVSEYLAPMKTFCEQGVTATVVFFGSARSRSGGVLGRYYEEATELARLVTEWSSTLTGQKLVICSGGGPGIMEAANRGAAAAHGRSVGLNIGLPHEQRPNPYITPELSFEFHYFFMRKLWFAHLAHALVAFPGGFGTFDELFEILTLAQTHKLDRSIPVFLYGREYWREVVNFDALVRYGTISAEDLKLFEFVDEPRAAFELLKQRISLEHATEAKPAFARSRCGPAPGQATSYFYGFSKLQSLRARVELALGKRFDAQSYHDFILAQGLLPPELLEKAVMEGYVKARLAAQ